MVGVDGGCVQHFTLREKYVQSGPWRERATGTQSEESIPGKGSTVGRERRVFSESSRLAKLLCHG